MILVTGAAGFIGSNIVSSLNKRGFHKIIICDWLDHISKRNNLNKLIYDNIISPENIFKYLNKNDNIELVIHMGANSSTTETNFRLIYNFNTRFSRNLWKWCTQNKVRFIYASSAATYGDGSKGFDDSENKNISGIFNCGTGIERSFEDLVTSMFKAINVPPKIKYIEMPENIKHQYQYYTRANMKKVIDKGYKIKALTLEEGVYDYVTNYLLSNDKYK